MSQPGAPAGKSFRILYPFEILYLTAFLLAVLMLRYGGVGVNWFTFEYIAKDAIPGFFFYFVLGIGLQVLYHLITRKSVREYFKAISNVSWVQLWVRILISSAFAMYSYVWVKFSLPLINWNLYDVQLWFIDRAVHLGISPSLFMTELFNSPLLRTGVDYWYSWWLPIQLYSTGFFLASSDNVFRRRFVYSQLLLWTLGLWMYVAVPALGPVYAFKQDWQHVQASMPKNYATQQLLIESYRNVVQSRQTGRIKAPFNPALGIAAMPSLHVAVLWFFFLWSRKYARALSLFYAVGTILILIGSVVTGWHYAIDGYVGMILAYIAYRAALLVEKDEPAGAPAPALQEPAQPVPAAPSSLSSQ